MAGEDRVILEVRSSEAGGANIPPASASTNTPISTPPPTTPLPSSRPAPPPGFSEEEWYGSTIPSSEFFKDFFERDPIGRTTGQIDSRKIFTVPESDTDTIPSADSSRPLPVEVVNLPTDRPPAKFDPANEQTTPKRSDDWEIDWSSVRWSDIPDSKSRTTDTESKADVDDEILETLRQIRDQGSRRDEAQDRQRSRRIHEEVADSYSMIPPEWEGIIGSAEDYTSNYVSAVVGKATGYPFLGMIAGQAAGQVAGRATYAFLSSQSTAAASAAPSATSTILGSVSGPPSASRALVPVAAQGGALVPYGGAAAGGSTALSAFASIAGPLGLALAAWKTAEFAGGYLGNKAGDTFRDTGSMVFAPNDQTERWALDQMGQTTAWAAGKLATVGPLGPLGGAFVENTLRGLSDAALAATDSLEGMASNISTYSGPLSAALAERSVSEIMRDIDRADRLGPSLASFIRERTEFSESIDEIKLQLQEVIVPVLTLGLSYVNAVVGTAVNMEKSIVTGASTAAQIGLDVASIIPSVKIAVDIAKAVMDKLGITEDEQKSIITDIEDFFNNQVQINQANKKNPGVNVPRI